MKTYAPRTTIHFDASFTRASDGQNVDPTDVYFVVQYQSENPVTYKFSDAQVQRSDVGLYYVDFTPDREGQWRYAWQGVGTIQSATLDTVFRVMQSQLIS